MMIVGQYSVNSMCGCAGNTAAEGGAVWIADCPNVILRQNTFGMLSLCLSSHSHGCQKCVLLL